jgi:hypothetical protein
MLASSDYEGTVTLWDAFTGVKSRIFQVVIIVWREKLSFANLLKRNLSDGSSSLIKLAGSCPHVAVQLFYLLVRSFIVDDFSQSIKFLSVDYET